ncbi:carboxypeptidase M32 [Thiotrichales bacterium 19S3-7]|nr:carboxypeptidase M32 [Thiotrichales bacterium 19S3-7]MCF6801658.1 carboxypeptidase M32 [Thiotrichales bacterium 19S3-11]
MLNNTYQKIEDYYQSIRHIENANSILAWDEQTMMPVGASTSRNESLALLSQLIHQRLNSDDLKTMLNVIDETQLDFWQKSNIKWIKKRLTDASIIPEKLVTELTLNQKKSEQAWRKLRAENNYHDFIPYLEKTLSTVKEIAKIKAQYYNTTNYDALLEDYSPGITSSQIDPIFTQLKLFLPDTIKQITENQRHLKTVGFNQKFPVLQQKELSFKVMNLIGFNFDYGRLDTAVHPFCGGTKSDVRITTRYNENEFISSLMAVCHETGHAMYEQQLPNKWQYQPVGDALGMTVHESQSLLVEMHACRSIEFMEILSNLVKVSFNSQDEAFSKENLYHHYTKVTPGLIRVDADEVTYPLHVILRYELEKALINEEISINDLVPLWDEKMQQYLSLDTKGNYKDGIMQDVHWPAGLFGYFPAYALGSMLAAQFYQAALRANCEIPHAIAKGDFKPLMNWLRDHVHAKASSLSFNQLVESATAKAFQADDYIEHIKLRYLS